MLVVEGVLLGTAVLVLFIHALCLWWYTRWSGTRLVRGRKALIEMLAEGLLSPKELAWLSGLPFRLQIKLFAGLASSLSGGQRIRLMELAQKIGSTARAEARCQSRFWWRRLQGARVVTLLGGGERVVPPLFQDRHPLVRAQAVEWAVDHPTPIVIELLLALLNEPSGFGRFTVQDSLLRMGGVVAEPLACYLSTHYGKEAEAALEVALGLGEPKFLASALTLCRDETPRVRALAATLLGAIGGRDAVRVLMDLLGDSVPEVRSASAGSLGRLGHWPAASRLANLLRDQAWEVRREAALALLALGAPGILLLHRFLSDRDPFAADMARHVLDIAQMSKVTM